MVINGQLEDHDTEDVVFSKLTHRLPERLDATLKARESVPPNNQTLEALEARLLADDRLLKIRDPENFHSRAFLGNKPYSSPSLSRVAPNNGSSYRGQEN